MEITLDLGPHLWPGKHDAPRNQALGVLFGAVVRDDGDGGCPSERSVGSVVIVEVDEPCVCHGALGF